MIRERDLLRRHLNGTAVSVNRVGGRNGYVGLNGGIIHDELSPTNHDISSRMAANPGDRASVNGAALRQIDRT
jgi:hypothetical protein